MPSGHPLIAFVTNSIRLNNGTNHRVKFYKLSKTHHPENYTLSNGSSPSIIGGIPKTFLKHLSGLR